MASEPDESRNWLRTVLLPFAMTGAWSILWTLILMGSVPTHREGICDAVSIPWPTFAAMALLPQIVVPVFLAPVFQRDRRTRTIAFLVTAFSIVFFSGHSLELLDRFWRGMF